MADSTDECLIKLAASMRHSAACSRNVVATYGRIHPEHLGPGELMRHRQELLELHKGNAAQMEELAKLLEAVAASYGRHHS